jgi:hypothetical protein
MAQKDEFTCLNNERCGSEAGYCSACVDALIADERERCALLAESPECHCKTEDIHDGCCGACGIRIAKAIRKHEVAV